MNGNEALVSVLIPAYNHKDYIQETIRSIISQTYKNIELIVIDDGSKDTTWKKINELKEECENRFTKVFFKTKPNGGTCETLNMLLEEAKGEYIYIIASDDIAKPQAIEKEVVFLENNPEYVLVVGDNELIDANSNRIGWTDNQEIAPLSTASFTTFGDFLNFRYKEFNLKSDNFGKYYTFVTINNVPNGYLTRAKAIKSFGGFVKEAPLEDLYMHLQLSKLGKYKYLDEILFSYRWHDNNTIKKSDYMKRIVCQTRSYERKLLDNIGNEKWRDIFDKNICRTKLKFKIGNILKYYSVKDLECKRNILSVFGHDFIVKKKPI